MSRDPRALALTYVRTHQVMTLATVGKNGVWAAAVFYAADEFLFYFISAAHTRHAQNIAQNPHVAATIQEDYKDWPAIQGIQLEGEIALLHGDAQQKAITFYQRRFPFIADADASMQAALLRMNWYCLRPDQLYFIDNQMGLGHRDLIRL